MQDMVYQGTVLGPSLWNTFFQDARLPVNESGFMEIVFADDLSAWKLFQRLKQNQRLTKLCSARFFSARAQKLCLYCEMPILTG